MFLPDLGQFRHSKVWRPFPITPLIDIIFLLIIFFLVVSRFIEAENFPVSVPAGCDFAQNEEKQSGRVITVTIMKKQDGRSVFAVDSKRIVNVDYNKIAEQIAELLDSRMKNLPSERRVVTLRIDKKVVFSEAQYALAGIARSSATDIKLAALKKNQVPAR